MRKLVYRTVGWLLFSLLDLVDYVRNRHDPLVPPRMIARHSVWSAPLSYPDQYRAVGSEFRQIFIEKAGLQPDDQILEIGCGTGRVSIGLTDYLSQQGSYLGIDVNARGVEWCQQHITPRYPNFEYRHIDVQNRHYNPASSTSATQYTLPFPDEAFDFVYLTSVFTHMPASEVDHYLKEIYRVLKPGAKCLMTVFILNEVSRNNIDKGIAQRRFQYEFGDYYADSQKVPEIAIAYTEDMIRKLISNSHLNLVEPIYFGKWSGRDDGLSGQDIILTKK